jgi:hypothetical protein
MHHVFLRFYNLPCNLGCRYSTIHDVFRSTCAYDNDLLCAYYHCNSNLYIRHGVIQIEEVNIEAMTAKIKFIDQ